jgi:hypothetical protein
MIELRITRFQSIKYAWKRNAYHVFVSKPQGRKPARKIYAQL